MGASKGWVLPSQVYLHTEPPTPPPGKFCQVECLVRKQHGSPDQTVEEKASPHSPICLSGGVLLVRLNCQLLQGKNKYKWVKITSAWSKGASITLQNYLLLFLWYPPGKSLRRKGRSHSHQQRVLWFFSAWARKASCSLVLYSHFLGTIVWYTVTKHILVYWRRTQLWQLCHNCYNTTLHLPLK